MADANRNPLRDILNRQKEAGRGSAMTKLPGRISIFRSSGSGKDHVLIEVIDDASRCIATSIEVDVAAFADAMFGRGNLPCEFLLNESGVIGATAETKTVLVPFKDNYRTTAAVGALRPFEVDGWWCDGRDLYNGHRGKRVKGVDFQEVTLHRYVRDGKPVAR